jgi:hypothetical protein
VGVPYKDVSGARNAGAIVVLRADPQTGDLLTGQEWDQDSPGVAGKAQRWDHFGASIGGGGLVVGVPQESFKDIGYHAGMVQLFSRSTSTEGFLAPGKGYSQNSPGIPGRIEISDAFGTSVVAGALPGCPGRTTFAIAAPGETIGTALGAGTVLLLPEPAAVECAPRVLYQGHGLPGRFETGDGTGGGLSLVPADPGDDASRIDQLLIGVPGERVAGSTQYGRLLVWNGSAATYRWLAPIAGGSSSGFGSRPARPAS